LGALFLIGIQELLGCKDVKATMVCIHVLNQGPKEVWNPADKVKVVSYTGDYKTLPLQGKNTKTLEINQLCRFRR
jgi:hypothetical protein